MKTSFRALRVWKCELLCGLLNIYFCICISLLFVEHKHNFSGSGSSVFSGGKSSEADCWSFAIHCCSAGTLLHNTRPHQVRTMGNTQQWETQQCRVIMGVCHSLLFRRDTTTQYATPSCKNNGQHNNGIHTTMQGNSETLPFIVVPPGHYCKMHHPIR